MRKAVELEAEVDTNVSPERRDFMQNICLSASAAMILGSGINDASAQSSYSAADAFNFVLNLKYLNYRFNRLAIFGYFQTPVSSQLVFSSEIFAGGVGAVGRVSGGHQVPFTDPVVKGISDEFQTDELNHIFLLRRILGSSTFVNQPAIDLNLGFVEFARLAGLASQGGPTFDAFANDTNFLTASLILEDLLVTAIAGVLPLVRDNEFLDVATGILATNAYHAGIVRALMAERGLFTQGQQVSDLRDFYDGPSDIDQGIGTAQRANIVPADANAILMKRTPEQVLSIVYLNPTNRPFGFFTSGLNGTIR